MSRPVSDLEHDETARFDPARLEQLCRDKGEARAETEAAEALDRIARLLGEISDGDGLPQVRFAARVESLIAAADKIGMATLARVARDVRICLDRGDPVALAATRSRLGRVGERSIHAIFDLDDRIV
ncbi:hypothetical protein HKCCE2091_01985 [Rhodobacterales bacterium HKCCE2091]|nr:hypothetical protein [Rhodobacterales bacterium HKCCE2091]